jgi:predicted MFS family arabinose efflux permease
MRNEFSEVPVLPAAPHPSWTPPPSRRDPLHPRLRPRAARFAVATLFFLNGALFATWVARIPALQTRHDFNHGQLGLALLAVALGAIVAMPLAGKFITWLGSETVCKASALLFCAFLPVLLIAPNTPLFIVSLAFFGAAHGALDVAMNAHAVEVEKRYRTPIMSSFHALFSIGGLAGAAVGGGVAALGLTPLLHFSSIAILFTAVALAISPRLLKTTRQNNDVSSQVAHRPAHISSSRSRGLAALGIVALCIMMGEGAIADWSGVYLRTIRASTESVAATGYAAFSIAMAFGRFFGDKCSLKLGAVRMVRTGGFTAAAGLIIALVVPGVAATLIGLACVGLGFSTIVPIVFSAAGRTSGIEPSVALATVTTMGYLGFLVGPPLIGFVAQFAGLSVALGVIVVTSLLSVTLASAVAPRYADAPSRWR